MPGKISRLISSYCLSNALDQDFSEVLAVAVLLLISLSSLLFENDHFVAFHVAKDFTNHFNTAHERSAQRNGSVIISKKNIGELNGVTIIAGKLVSVDELAALYFGLLTCDFYNCVHQLQCMFKI